MTPSYIPLAIVLPPLLGALLVVAFALRSARSARALVLSSSALSLLSAGVALWRSARGEVLACAFGGWAAPYGIVYRVDGLSALMAVLIAAIGMAVFVYAGPSLRTELPKEQSSFLATASLLVSALLGMVVTGDLFNLYVFLEIASITAYTLIAAGGGTAALASFRYLLIGTVGASFYLLGLGYLFAMTGTLNMADMALRLQAVGDPAALRVALALVVTGFALKMALFPMHGWLPDAYTYAPSAASALIAAVMTKVNAFVLLRLLYGVFWPALGALNLPVAPLLGWLGVAAILAGSLMALAQTDLKRLLAYSSVSHLGYLALGISLGNQNGLLGTMLHIVAHALTKGCLFLIVGGVEYRSGARTLQSWRGMNRAMPISMGAFVIAALSMIGVPPTAGFFSKWYLVLGALDAGQVAFALVLLVSSLLNAWYFFRLIETVYFEPPVDDHSVPACQGELPRTMLGPIVVLAGAVVVVGVMSNTLVRHVLRDAVGSLRGVEMHAVTRTSEIGTRDGRN